MNVTQGTMDDSKTQHALLLMTTHGRYSGKPDAHLMTYRRHGADFVVAATNVTENTKPEWYLNLKEEPIVHLEVNGDTFYARATTPVGTDRVRLLPVVEEISGGVGGAIPRDTAIVVLSPIA